MRAIAYFGLKSYGTLYGVMFGLFNFGTGLGPFLMGWSFDRFHSYAPMFPVFEAALTVTCLLFARLGPYPFPVGVAPLAEDLHAAEAEAPAPSTLDGTA